jgi:hypothetical protein
LLVTISAPITNKSRYCLIKTVLQSYERK